MDRRSRPDPEVELTVTLATPTHQDPGASIPTVRWKRGHQAFHLYLVAMNGVLNDALLALDAGEQSALTASLRDLAVLYDAATAGMKYAADFATEDYETVVRPSMMPPFVNPGFSGLLNRDHAVMLNQLRSLRTQLVSTLGREQSEWPPAASAAMQAVRVAQQRNRAHHMLVCRKFVSDGVSLLRDFYANQRTSKE